MRKKRKFRIKKIKEESHALYSKKNTYLASKKKKVILSKNTQKCIYFFNVYIWNILLFLLNFISYVFYKFSLESCGTASTNKCTKARGMKWYYKLGKLSIIAGIIQSISLSLIFLKNKGYKHLLYDFPIYISFFYIYNGTSVEEHGLYNSMIFLITLSISTFILTYILYFLYFLVKRNKLCFLFIIFVFYVIIFGNKYKPYDNCPNWGKSINNTIDNDSKDYPCKIMFPKKCVMDKLGNIVDMPRYFNTECHTRGVRKNEKKVFINSLKASKNINKSNILETVKNFGYPITTTSNYFKRWPNDNSFATYVNEHTIILDENNNINNNFNENENILPPEVILTFGKSGYGTINQKINFNENLSLERKRISENKKSLFNNIFMFYLDTLSSKHFYRKLPKTSKFFKKYFEYNENYSEKKFSAFEFLKYHALNPYTIGNIYPMNYGCSARGGGKGVFFVKYLKENGFVTGSAGTICSKDSVFSDELDLYNVEYEPYDHENVALFCDRNFYDTGYSLINGINSVLHRCLYGKEGYEYAMEYAELFWKAYKDNKKYFRLHIYEGHELTQELIKYADDNIYNFFDNFYNKGYFDDTLLIIISDHGNNFHSYYSLLETINEDRKIEGYLPVFKIVIPNKKIIYESGLYNNLYENQQTFISPFDVYNSIIHASCTDYKDIDTRPKNHFERGDIYSWRGYSIFNLIDYKQRYCHNPELNLSPTKCVCNR